MKRIIYSSTNSILQGSNLALPNTDAFLVDTNRLERFAIESCFNEILEEAYYAHTHMNSYSLAKAAVDHLIDEDGWHDGDHLIDVDKFDVDDRNFLEALYRQLADAEIDWTHQPRY